MFILFGFVLGFDIRDIFSSSLALWYFIETWLCTYLFRIYVYKNNRKEARNLKENKEAMYEVLDQREGKLCNYIVINKINNKILPIIKSMYLLQNQCFFKFSSR